MIMIRKCYCLWSSLILTLLSIQLLVCNCFSSNGILIQSKYRSSMLQSVVQLRGSRNYIHNIPISHSKLGVSSLEDTSNKIDKPQQLTQFLRSVWDFSRPHTIIGSGISLLSLYMFAVPIKYWKSMTFLNSFLFALIPSLFMNLYITGLNQLTDIDIDKINKPNLPLASGRLTKGMGIAIVIASLLISLSFSIVSDSYLRMTLLGSCLLGTVYSLPPFRLKRFPLLAALCILVVRGSLVNFGFYLSAKDAVLKELVPKSLFQAAMKYPESGFVTAFFAIFGVVIALMKDVPDVSGDKVGKIPSFSVQYGPRSMLRLARLLLSVLLVSTGIGILLSSANLAFKWQLSRYTLATILVWLGIDVRIRGKAVDAQDSKPVSDYYMHVWKVFYACYVMLPFLR